jgi:D-sedoheptulose 7-phosphate isomerase
MNDYWSKYSQTMTQTFGAAQASNAKGESLTVETGLQLLCQWSKSLQEARRIIHFVGNGASACIASHMAIDWTKNAGVRALAYNDIAFLTAIGNDLGYDQVFAQPVGWFGEQGDLLATISSSGNSPNVINAIASARKQGLKVVTFSGMNADNKSRLAGDLNFYAPARTYGIVESSHQVLLHAWLDCFMNIREWERASS